MARMFIGSKHVNLSFEWKQREGKGRKVKEKQETSLLNK